MKIPLVKGDRIEGVDYRDALPQNALTISKPVHGVAGYMISHPGLVEYGTTPGRDRGGIYNERITEHLRVSGNNLVRLNTSGLAGDYQLPIGTTEVIGTISGEGSVLYSQATLPYSFNTQAIITDQKFWLYDGTTLSEVTDPSVGTPISGDWIDGYYLLTDGEFLFHTTLQDEYAFEPTAFATSEFSPDPTLCIIKTADNQAAVFNRFTTEWFYHEPQNPSFKFNRIATKAVKTGITGPHAAIEMSGLFYCLGSAKNEAPGMYVIVPGRAEKFSTREIDQIIAEYTEQELATVVLEKRVQDDNQLIYVRLPNHTLIYNHTLAQKNGLELAWSEGVSTPLLCGTWPGVNGVFDIPTSEWIYGDRSESRLGVLGGDATQYGVQQESIFYSPFVNLETNSIDQFSIETIAGVTTQFVSVFFSLTFNGRSYGQEYPLAYGGESQYGQRYIARRLGNINDWVGFRFRVVSPGPVNFCNMVISVG